MGFFFDGFLRALEIETVVYAYEVSKTYPKLSGLACLKASYRSCLLIIFIFIETEWCDRRRRHWSPRLTKKLMNEFIYGLSLYFISQSLDIFNYNYPQYI